MRPLDGYPTSFGNIRTCVFPHAGPASYTQVVIPSPPAVPTTGGDLVEAIEAGMKYFDTVFNAVTDDALYEVKAIPVSASNVGAGVGAPTTTYRLMWVVVSTGAEVAAMVDLSGSVVRLTAWGPK